MSVLAAIFGRRARSAAPLASAEIAAEITSRRAILATARERVEAATAKRLAARDDLKVAVMVEAENDAATARAEVEAAEHALAALEAAHADALAREAAEALTACRDSADRRASEEGDKLLDAYDRLAAEMASVFAGLHAIDAEVTEVNRALVAAGRRDERIESIDARFRQTPSRQEPDRVETVEVVEEMIDGEWGPVIQLLRQRDGSMASAYPTRTVKREVRRRGRFRSGVSLPSLVGIELPAGRINGERHWPREAQ